MRLVASPGVLKRGTLSVVVAAGALLLPAAVALGQKASAKTPPTVRVWAYVGPEAPLGGAKVKLRDRDGKVVAQARTTRRGTYEFRFRGRSPKLPLTATTYGGRAAGKAFTGNMQARVFSLKPSAAVTQLSVISTAAARMSKSSSGYSNATKRVRRSMKIHAGALADVLRIRNSDVGYSQLMKKYSQSKGGFNGFAKYVADTASKSKYIGGLRPKLASESGAVPPIPPVRVAQSTPNDTIPDTINCADNVPTQNTTQDVALNALSDVGAIAIGTLLHARGAPDSVADGVMGMLLAPIGRGDAVQSQDISDILDQLSCIDEQMNYLSSQISQVQESVDVLPATSCSNAVQGTAGWGGYKFLINNSEQYPINSSNQSLTQTYLPAWNQLNTICGSAINSMLFGTSGGQDSAWQQLNRNTSAGIKWYTQEQNQSLQVFLAYWGTVLYQQFVLTNEYDNYNGADEAASAAAGGTVTFTGTTPVTAASIDTDSISVQCSPGSTAQSATYCVWMNNLLRAFPGTLFSDEVGIIATGQSVSAVPGGMIAGIEPQATPPAGAGGNTVNSQVGQANGYAVPRTGTMLANSPMAMSFQWWFNYYLGSAPNSGIPTGTVTYTAGGGVPSCPNNARPGSGCPWWSTENFSQQSADWFNALGWNPNRYPTGIQTFENPQDPRRSPVSGSDVSDLTSAGPDSLSAEDFFLGAINQTPTGGTPAWGAVSSSQPSYMASDSTMTVDFNLRSVGDSLEYYVDFTPNVPVGYSGAYNNVNWNPSGLGVPNQVTGFLTGRPWWKGSSNANNYTPPAPPTG